MEVKVSGLQELETKMVELGQIAGTKAMRSAMWYATTPLLSRAKELVSNRSGSLQVALSRRFVVGAASNLLASATGSKFTVQVLPKAKNRTAIALYNLVYKPKRPRRGIFYGHLVEFDHRVGKSSRVVQGTHFLLNALRATQTTVMSRFVEALGRKVAEALRKR